MDVILTVEANVTAEELVRRLQERGIDVLLDEKGAVVVSEDNYNKSLNSSQ